MKKRFLTVVLFTVVMLFAQIAGNSPAATVRAAEEDTAGNAVDIMFLHDTHSHLNAFATVEDGKSQMMGGFARIMTLQK